MYKEVYIDLVFLTNLLMDYVLLRLVGRLFRFSKRRGRCLLGAGVGALISCLVVCMPTETGFFARTLIHGISGVSMLKVSFGLKKNGTMIKAVTALYLTAFLCGGFWEAVISGNGLTLKAFVLSAGAAYLFLSGALSFADAIRAQRRNLYPVTLSYRGRVRSACGFYDTGNLLTDPVSGAPVSVIATELLQLFLSDVEMEALKHIKENPGELKSTELMGMRPHFLPCTTVGGGERLLLAVTLEELMIHTPGEVVCIHKPMFALSLEPSALGREYKVLLNSRLLY